MVGKGLPGLWCKALWGWSELGRRAKNTRTDWFGSKKVAVDTCRLAPDLFWGKWEKKNWSCACTAKCECLQSLSNGGSTSLSLYPSSLTISDLFLPHPRWKAWSISWTDNPQDFRSPWNTPQKHLSLENFLLTLQNKDHQLLSMFAG